MADYDILLKHIPGTKMIPADTLSRRPDHAKGIENDNVDVIALPNRLFISLIDLDLQRAISDGYTLDDFAQHILSNINDYPNDHPDWTHIVENDTTFLDFKGRQYVPADLNLRRQILKLKHDALSAGHPGILETLLAVSKDYYWPGLRTFVRNYVAGCLECQRFKINRHPACPALMPVPAAPNTRLFAHTSMDFLTDLPPANDRNDSILV